MPAGELAGRANKPLGPQHPVDAEWRERGPQISAAFNENNEH